MYKNREHKGSKGFLCILGLFIFSLIAEGNSSISKPFTLCYMYWLLARMVNSTTQFLFGQVLGYSKSSVSLSDDSIKIFFGQKC